MGFGSFLEEGSLLLGMGSSEDFWVERQSYLSHSILNPETKLSENGQRFQNRFVNKTVPKLDHLLCILLQQHRT